jgi:hypothetical protein
MGYLRNLQKTGQKKQSPNGQKFAQSGHPVSNPPSVGAARPKNQAWAIIGARNLVDEPKLHCNFMGYMNAD